MLDDVLSYDPLSASYAFSPLGYSGLTAGTGDTEDARLDNSIKYVNLVGPIRAAALYKFDSDNAEARRAYEGDLGFVYRGLSADAIVNHVSDAISVASLSAAQVLKEPQGSLAATVSDNTSYGLMAKYATTPLFLGTIYAGWEHIMFHNPASPVPAGAGDIGGYVLSVVNNTAYTHHRDLDVVWAGLKYHVTHSLDTTVAYYHYGQANYDTVACSNASAGSCSGALDAVSLAADYKFNKYFDVYAGTMYSKVADGLASGYLHNNTVNTMTGVRFNF